MKEKISLHKYKILFLMLFLIGFFATFSYGKYWDENTEQRILYMNIKEYVMRLAPSDSAIYQEYDANPLEPISQNKDRDHGVAAYYPIHFIIQSDISPQARMHIWHLYTFFIFFGGVLCLYYVMEQLSNKKWLGLVTSLMYYLSPRIFADGHYNNKDMVALSFFLYLTALFLSILKKVTWWKILLASLVVAVLTNTKIIGLCLAGALVLMYVIVACNRKVSIKTILCILGSGLAASLVFLFLLTPAMWDSVVDYFIYNVESSTAFLRWDGYIRFRGNDYRNVYDPLPKYYLPYMIVITTPIYVLVCAAIGHLSLLVKLIKQKLRFFKDSKNMVMTIMFITWFMPVVYAVLSNMPLYNSWRHLFFIYGPFIILAGFGVEQLFEWIEKKNSKKGHLIATSILGICILFSALGIVVNHPYEYGYYNVLAGKAADEKYDMDYWNVSMKDALEYVTGLQDNAVTVTAFEYYSYDGIKESSVIVDTPEKIKVVDDYEENWKDADYLVVNVTYGLIYDEDTYEQVRQEYQLIHTIESYGNAMIEIYRK